ncbi:hypothetical protein AEQU1_02795 [Aequorivita sp. CIP111184]|nr:hypothetical protein AEQU2_02754 [Aequorivita lipolytica]SRX55770.1 hypothetical protein AEQU1_02795 [Aequorivita sp. CIP111184]
MISHHPIFAKNTRTNKKNPAENISDGVLFFIAILCVANLAKGIIQD